VSSTRYQRLHLTIVGDFLDGQTFEFDGAPNTWIAISATGHRACGGAGWAPAARW